MPVAEEKTRMDINEVSRMLGRSKRSIYQMCWRRQIPFRRRGHKLHFYREELVAWLDNAPGVRPEEIEVA
jgi:excisionase family DNA binding protein